jgi:hypothetical protein
LAQTTRIVDADQMEAAPGAGDHRRRVAGELLRRKRSATHEKRIQEAREGKRRSRGCAFSP